ncbi:tyrosine-type recombinase/integrase [Spiroplasma sp. SV19]|nr:tyrosine-type recombinase/integrase [Spiroplasma sp. SV19]
MYKSFKKYIYKKIKEYWDEWVTPHSFRRSFCTNLIESGANIKIVSLIMGHSKIETTARYIHFNKTKISKELEQHL